jgi:hypothetical protein
MGHFLAALFGKLCADEIKAWLPWITEKVTRAAITKLPANKRERYSEEWASYLNEVPGELTKIWVACGFFWAANVRPHFTHTSTVAESRNVKIASSVHGLLSDRTPVDHRRSGNAQAAAHRRRRATWDHRAPLLARQHHPHLQPPCGGLGETVGR